MNKFTFRAGISATCYDCRKEWWEKNAMGVAARHATATGHHVSCEQTFVTSWNTRAVIDDRKFPIVGRTVE
ncbi:MAG: hypothetical protein E5W19_18490 [Mesorhizobium sp.]|nr:MAG: hypothetical protein E5W19_18490 [Mesorhizobium sp.]